MEISLKLFKITKLGLDPSPTKLVGLIFSAILRLSKKITKWRHQTNQKTITFLEMKKIRMNMISKQMVKSIKIKNMVLKSDSMRMQKV